MPFRFVNLPGVAVLGAVSQTTRRASEWPAVLRPAFLASSAVISARLRFVKCQLSKRNTFLLAISLAFLTLMAFYVRFTLPASGRGYPRPGSAAACRMVRAWGRGFRRRCRSPSARRSVRNIGRRATLLPSPLRCSFLPVMVSRWWSPFCSSALFLRLSCWGLWCSFLPCWVWLYTGVYYSLFNRARNKRARTRRGWRCFSLLLCPLRSCWRRFSLGVGVGALLRQ